MHSLMKFLAGSYLFKIYNSGVLFSCGKPSIPNSCWAVVSSCDL